MIFTKCHFLADFRFLAQKGPPKKKFNKNASLYLMNFDYLSYESNLLFLGHPHICERGGGAEPLHCIPSIGLYIHIYIYNIHNTYIYNIIFYSTLPWKWLSRNLISLFSCCWRSGKSMKKRLHMYLSMFFT